MHRVQGTSPEPKTKAVYLPLIDMPPAHPDTIMTALIKAQQLTGKIGQHFTVFTADQQLYRVAVDFQWAHPDLFPNLILRLHMLMSFVDAIGTLMTETGLSEVLKSIFGGVEKILTGKKFPMNVTGMHMVDEELLRCVIEKTQLKDHHDFLNVLEDLASKSHTSKMWLMHS